MWIYNSTKGEKHFINGIDIYKDLANKENKTEEELLLLSLIVYRDVEHGVSVICSENRDKYCYKYSSDKSYDEALLRNRKEVEGFYLSCLNLSDKYSEELEEKKKNKEVIEDYKIFFIELFRFFNIEVFDVKYEYYKKFIAEIERRMQLLIKDFKLTDIGIGSDI